MRKDVTVTCFTINHSKIPDGYYCNHCNPVNFKVSLIINGVKLMVENVQRPRHRRTRWQQCGFVMCNSENVVEGSVSAVQDLF